MDNSVSVIIPVYNAEPFVEEAVRSALQQPEVLEVVLVDDAGPDGSLAVCERMAASYPRVRLYRHPDHGNHGAAASRNLGLTKACGIYVAFLDADDVFLPGRFAHERRIFAQHPDADGVYGALGVLFHTDEARAHYERQGMPPLTTVGWEVPPERLCRSLLETGKGFGYFHLDALTVKREALERLPYVFPDDVVLHEDTDMIYRLAHHARLYAGSIREPVALRGVHAANRITNNAQGAYTRYTLYHSLVRWARAQKLDPDLVRRLEILRMRYRVENTKSRVRLLAMLPGLLLRPWMLDHIDLRSAYFDALFGTGGRVSVFFQKATWRLLHGLFPGAR